MTTRIEMFVDYVCPFCFLVEDVVARLERERDVEIDIRPFELRPGPVPTLRPEDDYLPRIWRDAVYPMARRLGVDITLPSLSPQPRTDRAFVVLGLAQERGLARAYSEAMFRAFFQDDRDIGDDDVIVEVAGSVGLDRASVEAALRDPARWDRQRRDQADATAAGVHAVPSFRIAGRLHSGVLDADTLVRAVDAAEATP